MGLFDFNSDPTLLGLSILANNQNNYGRFTPALTGGISNFMASKAAMREQALKEQRLAQERALKEQQAALQKQQLQQKLNAYRQKQEAIGQLPENIQPYVRAGAMDAYKAMHPIPSSQGSYGTSLYFDTQGNAYQASKNGGLRKLKEKIVKPMQFLNLGGQQVGVDRYQGTPKQTYQVTPKPEAMPEFKSNVKTAEEQAKRKIELQKAKSKIERTAASALNKYQLVDENIDRAINDSGVFTTGFIGSTTSEIPGTPAHDLQNTLNTIKANIGFDKLQEMRDASPTGGALGQVSEMENKLLQQVWGSVEQSQSQEQLVENLNNLKKQIKESWQRISDAYEKDYGVPLDMEFVGAKPSSAKQTGDGWNIKELP